MMDAIKWIGLDWKAELPALREIYYVMRWLQRFTACLMETAEHGCFHHAELKMSREKLANWWRNGSDVQAKNIFLKKIAPFPNVTS